MTPQTLLRLHGDSAFPEFRSELATMFTPLSTLVGKDEFEQLVAEYERDVLLPKLQRIQSDLSAGPIARAIKKTPIALFSFVQSVAVGLPVSVTALSQLLAPVSVRALSELLRPKPSDKEMRIGRLWASLLPEKGDLTDFFAPRLVREPEVKDPQLKKIHGWDIPSEPSMKVRVTEGRYYVEPPDSPTITAEIVKQTGRNDRCPCGSGLKFKKCCGYGIS